MVFNPPQPLASRIALASGSATAATATTVTDSNATFPTLTNAYIMVISAANPPAYQPQIAKITSNTATVITTASWGTTPAVGDGYYVFESINTALNSYFNTPTAITDEVASPTISQIQSFDMIYSQALAKWIFPKSDVGARQVGTANTQLQFVFKTYNIRELSILFQSSGGSFAAQSATVEVSPDNTNWVMIDSGIALGAGTSAAKEYDATHLGTTLAVNPVDYPYIRITVPALGASISAIVTYSGK